MLKAMAETTMLTVEKLAKNYDGVQALNQVSFEIKRERSRVSSVPTGPGKAPSSTSSAGSRGRIQEGSFSRGWRSLP